MSVTSSLEAADQRYVPNGLEQLKSSQEIHKGDLPKKDKDQKVLVSKMKGLLLLGAPDQAKHKPREKIKGVVIRGFSPPGSRKRFIRRLEPLIIGKPLTKKSLSELKREIVRYYRGHNRHVMMVLVPEQDVTNKILQLVVVETRVGHVSARGQRHFSGRIFKEGVHLKKGDRIKINHLLSDLAWLNENPFHQTNVVFKPGKKQGTTDVELVTRDRFPFRFFAGADNSGEPFTGETRLFAGFNWGNAFDLDHQFSFQTLTSTDVKRFTAYSANYVAPLPWHHTLIFFGGYSQVKPHLEHFNQLGRSAQISGRYKIPLGKTYGDFLRHIQVGYDFKETNNNLEFIANNQRSVVETKLVQLGQFVATYHMSWLPKNHVLNFDAELYFSPFKHWYEHQNSNAFHRLQEDASPIYFYTEFIATDQYKFSEAGWNLFSQVRCQFANKILLPSEQFALGGFKYGYVRGYLERIVAFDNAAVANIEVRTPSVPLSKYVSGKNIGDQLFALAFVDVGAGWPYKREKRAHSLDGVPQALVGVGPGIRYAINPYLLGRFDLGFPLINVKNNGWHPRIHFSAVVSY